MCGIIARQEFHERAFSLVRGLNSLECRGPDSQTEWLGPSTALGCARLTLWTEGQSAQPRVLGNDVGVFNGELFNLDDLRNELGLPNASEIDVLIHGVRHRGVEFLNLIDGQFAGIIYSHDLHSLTAFRDRWGILPLYFSTKEHECVIASTIPALRSEGVSDLTLDPRGVAEISSWWAAVPPSTAWKNIAQVPPGGWIKFASSRLVSQGRWTHNEPVHSRTAVETELTASFASKLREEFESSLRRRVRGRTSVAIALSGGIDSTVIATVARDQGLLRSYGLCLSDDDPLARRQLTVAREIGLEHSLVVASPSSVLAEFRPTVVSSGIPLTRLGPVGMRLLAERVHADGIRVVLSGEGADELFAGYDSFRISALAHRVLTPPTNNDWNTFGASEFDAGNRNGGVYWRVLSSTGGNPLRSRLNTGRFVAPFLQNEGLEEIKRLHEWAAKWDGAADPIEAVREMEIQVLLGGYLLTIQSDHAWASQAVEVRYPWLGLGVAKLALSAPARLMIQETSGKTPVFHLANGLFKTKPGLKHLDFGKKAYRIECLPLITDRNAFAGLRELCSHCPPDLVKTKEVLRVLDACHASGRCSEVQSSLFVLTASLGVLCG